MVISFYFAKLFDISFSHVYLKVSTRLKSHSSALLISRYILRLGQRGRCCFWAASPNRKMYLEIRNADEEAFSLIWNTILGPFKVPYFFLAYNHRMLPRSHFIARKKVHTKGNIERIKCLPNHSKVVKCDVIVQDGLFKSKARRAKSVKAVQLIISRHHN